MPSPGHPGEVNWFKQQFWTAAGFCDLGQQADLYGAAENVKIIPWFRNLSHPDWFVAYEFAHVTQI